MLNDCKNLLGLLNNDAKGYLHQSQKLGIIKPWFYVFLLLTLRALGEYRFNIMCFFPIYPEFLKEVAFDKIRLFMLDEHFYHVR